MQKLSGVHFYINIDNYNQIILDEESRTGGVTHAIHALDTFFTSIERFGKKQSKQLVVEKITGSRLHLYVVDELLPAFQVVKAVSVYAFIISKYINTEIPKYKTLKDFKISIGAAYGKFYDFEFTPEKGDSETTTIGYAANFAAKLQALSEQSKISISEDVFNAIPTVETYIYQEVKEPSIKKYSQDKYYTAHLSSLTSPVSISEADKTEARVYANSNALGDIEFSGVKAPLNFRSLSITQCKKLEGIPVFADVRDFTSQFEDNDSNLDRMAQKTQQILQSMYRVSSEHGGIHIQFQGDRELSLYHNVPEQTINGHTTPEEKCFKKAVLASMRMIDAVKPYSVHIGVGEDFGKLFATKLGARGSKDNILLGETVITADVMEDKYAGKDQVAITAEVFEGLNSEDSFLASKFKKEGSCFIATIGYQEYLNSVSYRQGSANTSQNRYNGAWGDLE